MANKTIRTLLFIVLTFLIAEISCPSRPTNNNYSATSNDSIQASHIGVSEGLKANNKFLGEATLVSFVAKTPADIKRPKNAMPFNKLNFNKVIAYEFEGRIEPYPSVINREGKFVPVVTKQNALTQNEVNQFTRLITSRASYGQNGAACFDPHLGVVFYNDNKLAGQVSICLSCNYLSSSIDINAPLRAKFPGFSPEARKEIKKLCDKYNYFYEKESMFDKPN